MTKYQPYEDGVWVTMHRRAHDIACCECGLVHRFHYRVRKGQIQWRAYRDNRQTANYRRGAAFKGAH